MNNNVAALFALIKSGLWGTEARLFEYREIDFSEVFRLSDEQSVVGIVTLGIDHVKDVIVPQEDVLQFIGSTLQLEEQNKAMNGFIEELIGKLREKDVYSLLVKGQGIAQCYERPLWRACGDIDLLVGDNDYDKAKQMLCCLSSSVNSESKYDKQLGLTIDSWAVELHGNLRSGLSRRVDKGLDDIKRSLFNDGKVRSWVNGKTIVFLPGEDEDVVYVFTHILQHFYKGGIGLRQICDWCRLLFTKKDSLNQKLLENRICKMGLMTEWRAFGAFAVEYLGMPPEAMPLFNENDNQCHNLHRKAKLIKDFVLEVGNMGHNRDMSYYNTKPYVVRKLKSMGMRVNDLIKHAMIFPIDTLRFFPHIILNGLSSAMRGE
jgi:hypothetical protein